jgi:Uma2 family endonuclease
MTAVPVEPELPELVVQLPERPLTLEDVTTLAAKDELHRYELADGALYVTPPADAEHAALITMILVWLVSHGLPADRVLATPGVRTAGADSGRIPDIAVVRSPARRGVVWLDPAEVLLIVEVVSRGSEKVDRAIKPGEYALAGFPHFWRVERDGATATVHRYRLGLNERGERTYRAHQATPLDELLAGDLPPLS